MEPDRVAPLRRRSDPLRRRGEPGNPRRGEVAPLGGKPRLRATKCAVVSSKRRLLFFFFFFKLLFNILKCDERINEARLPDPYVPFSAACA